MIEVNPPLCRLMDLNSTNGTSVNGKPVSCVDLKKGDVICGGDTSLRVDIEGETNGGLPDPTFIPSGCSRSSGAITDVLSHPPQFPGYQILEVLGRGGMGVVYKALTVPHGETVAIKVITPAVMADMEELTRFTREAEILRSLQHPHIVGFRELNHAHGQLYIAMDFIDGVDADRLAKAGSEPLSAARAIKIVCQVLEGLGHAHRHGFVHRDVKPSNIIVASRPSGDHVWLADFGLARAYQSSRLSGLTVVGQIGGSTRFMPPEPITHYRQVNPAADQYSAAATLYDLLTKTYVYDFPADVQRQLLMVLQEPFIPLSQRRPDLPAGLHAAMNKALNRDPVQRFANVVALRNALLAVHA